MEFQKSCPKARHLKPHLSQPTGTRTGLPPGRTATVYLHFCVGVFCFKTQHPSIIPDTKYKSIFQLCLRNNLKASHHRVVTDKKLIIQGDFSPQKLTLVGLGSVALVHMPWVPTQLGTVSSCPVSVCRNGGAQRRQRRGVHR